jgi:hypothetical protein
MSPTSSRISCQQVYRAFPHLPSFISLRLCLGHIPFIIMWRMAWFEGNVGGGCLRATEIFLIIVRPMSRPTLWCTGNTSGDHPIRSALFGFSMVMIFPVANGLLCTALGGIGGGGSPGDVSWSTWASGADRVSDCVLFRVCCGDHVSSPSL